MLYTTSSYSLTASLRNTITLLQSNLTRAQKEVSTGRHADLGVTLGRETGQAFTLAGAQQTVDATIASNSLVTARLDTTQVALSNLRADAQQLRSTLIASQTNGGDPSAIIAQARNALSTFTATLNRSNGDGFLFGGVNTDNPPIADYFSDPPSANKVALDASFSATFGFAQLSPAVASITSGQIQSFLSGAYDSLFTATNWKANWSQASDNPQRSQISLSVTSDSSITANEPALQKLAAAYAMVSDLAVDKLKPDTYATVLSTAMETLDSGISMLTKVQARVGAIQSSVKGASDIMSIQSSAIKSQLQDLESVDPAEASTRVNGLMTQLETAYTLTARISQLSLTKYL